MILESLTLKNGAVQKLDTCHLMYRLMPLDGAEGWDNGLRFSLRSLEATGEEHRAPCGEPKRYGKHRTRQYSA